MSLLTLSATITALWIFVVAIYLRHILKAEPTPQPLRKRY